MMLCLKQSRFPVFQLMTKEDDETPEQFETKTMDVAPVLKRLGVRGYVFNALFLLNAEHLIGELREMGFLIFTYGDPNNAKETVWHQLDLGVSGLCTDVLNDLSVTLSQWPHAEQP